MKVARLFWALLCGMALTSPTSAALITTQPATGTTVTFPGGGHSCPAGPTSATIAGFSITTSGSACYNFDDANFGLGANGSWEGFSLIGDNSASTTITIDLGGLHSSVGGFMNYCPECDDPGLIPPFIAALAADMNVLETHVISTEAPISTPDGDNDGAFRGISRASADIRFFAFGGSFSAFHNITLSLAPVGLPLPGTLALLGVGLAGLAFSRRRARR